MIGNVLWSKQNWQLPYSLDLSEVSAMTKHTDALKAALEKKHAATHPDADAKDTKGKAKSKPGSMAPAAKPMKKVTGRGR